MTGEATPQALVDGMDGPREVVLAASVVGRCLERDHLARPLPGRALLDDAFEALVLAGVLERRGGGPAFSHVLLRQTAYGMLHAGDRRGLHRAHAAMLRAHEPQPGAGYPHLLADHLRAGGDLDAAPAACLAAGWAFLGSAAFNDAIAHLEAAGDARARCLSRRCVRPSRSSGRGSRIPACSTPTDSCALPWRAAAARPRSGWWRSTDCRASGDGRRGAGLRRSDPPDGGHRAAPELRRGGAAPGERLRHRALLGPVGAPRTDQRRPGPRIRRRGPRRGVRRGRCRPARGGPVGGAPPRGPGGAARPRATRSSRRWPASSGSGRCSGGRGCPPSGPWPPSSAARGRMASARSPGASTSPTRRRRPSGSSTAGSSRQASSCASAGRRRGASSRGRSSPSRRPRGFGSPVPCWTRCGPRRTPTAQDRPRPGPSRSARSGGWPGRARRRGPRRSGGAARGCSPRRVPGTRPRLPAGSRPPTRRARRGAVRPGWARLRRRSGAAGRREAVGARAPRRPVRCRPRARRSRRRPGPAPPPGPSIGPYRLTDHVMAVS